MLEHLTDGPVGVFLIIISVILLAPIISQLFRLPDIIGIILGGILVGPFGLGLLERSGAIELLGTAGLIYLMFSAGAEIDLTQFNKVRNRSLVFGALTFIIPQALGTLIFFGLGYPLLSAVLIGSMFASHTLLAFPIITRLGLVRNEAVSVTVGATIVTDIAALLVLAAVAGISNGDVTPLYFVQLLVLLLIYTTLMLFGIPRLGRFFFKRFRARSLEFQFVLAVIFVAAFLAEVIGMEAIVGAFLAGLAINATVPHRSAVMGRVLFIGESFFVPIFLLSIGLLINPVAFFTDQRTLIVSAAMVGTVLITKFVASIITSRLYKYSPAEIQVMWGLSMAQAAATLAAALVGVRLGLLDDAVFNGAITMMLVTCVLSPILIERHGPRIQTIDRERTRALATVPEHTPIFSRILIPVANPNTEDYLLQLGGLLARATAGTLMPLNIARLDDNRITGLQHQQRLLASEHLTIPDTIVQPIRRVDASISDGILSAAIEHDASAIIMGWSGQSSFRETVFGRMLDRVIWRAPMPVLISRLTSSVLSHRAILLVIPTNSVAHEQIGEVLAAALSLASAINVPLHIFAAPPYIDDVHHCLHDRGATARLELLETEIIRQIARTADPQDLVLMTTPGSEQRFQSSLGSLPEDLAASVTNSLVVMRFPAPDPLIHSGD